MSFYTQDIWQSVHVAGPQQASFNINVIASMLLLASHASPPGQDGVAHILQTNILCLEDGTQCLGLDSKPTL